MANLLYRQHSTLMLEHVPDMFSVRVDFSKYTYKYTYSIGGDVILDHVRVCDYVNF